MTVKLTMELLSRMPDEVRVKAMDYVEKLAHNAVDTEREDWETCFHTLLDYALIGVLADAGAMKVEFDEEEDVD